MLFMPFSRIEKLVQEIISEQRAWHALSVAEYSKLNAQLLQGKIHVSASEMASAKLLSLGCGGGCGSGCGGGCGGGGGGGGDGGGGEGGGVGSAAAGGASAAAPASETAAAAAAAATAAALRALPLLRHSKRPAKLPAERQRGSREKRMKGAPGDAARLKDTMRKREARAAKKAKTAVAAQAE